MLESALSISVFLTMMFGVIEFGRAMFAYTQLPYLAQEGARYASIHGSTAPTIASAADVGTYVNTQAVGLSGLVIDTTWQSNQNVPGHWVQVKVTYPFTFLGPYMPGSMHLAAAAQDIISQ
jgi:Flp pilus assembly protein TadG